MPKTLLIVFLMSLLIGPIRRRVFGAWRFVVPAVLGGVIACMLIGTLAGAATVPAWIIIAVPITAALAIGSSCRQWFHDNFPPRRP